MNIHPTAIIEKSVELADGVIVGPFSVLRGRVRVGRGTRFESHVSVGSDTTIVEIGEKNFFAAGAIIGGPPQDISYKGEPTKLVIGNGNQFRECVTINCGTTKGGGVTKVGDNCMIMAYVHIAHDCHLGNNVILVNSVQLGGHVIVEDFARVNGLCGVVQYVRIGKYSYIGGASGVRKDIPPFCIAEGNDLARVRATNKVGLQRAGFSKEDVEDISRAIRFFVVGGRTVNEALQKISEECNMSSPAIQHLVNFIKTSENGIAR